MQIGREIGKRDKSLLYTILVELSLNMLLNAGQSHKKRTYIFAF